MPEKQKRQMQPRPHVNIYHYNASEMAEDVNHYRNVDILFVIENFRFTFNRDGGFAETHIAGRITPTTTIEVCLRSNDALSEPKLRRLLSARGLIGYVRGIHAVYDHAGTQTFYLTIPPEGESNRLILFLRFAPTYFNSGRLEIIQNVSIMNPQIRKKNRGLLFPLLREERNATRELIRSMYNKRTRRLDRFDRLCWNA